MPLAEMRLPNWACCASHSTLPPLFVRHVAISTQRFVALL